MNRRGFLKLGLSAVAITAMPSLVKRLHLSEGPTALGGESDVVFEGSINGSVLEIDAPEGLNQSVFNYYQFQAALGLWKGITFIY